MKNPSPKSPKYIKFRNMMKSFEKHMLSYFTENPQIKFTNILWKMGCKKLQKMVKNEMEEFLTANSIAFCGKWDIKNCENGEK